ncbi:hypothetical protein VD0002_g5519 [Verticillium dahliae]|uniref:superoxide dismutase n=2 Tax=Verticillium dahliae TaxID=27337 RepID=G2XEZ2_VERDV|nr:cytosolic Cu/Zn superoxide dismutase [Verticillium dahliae VdLs.17]KAF3348863.1 Catabolic 3-dehydroquinase [Verticillium dahliae VDG2]KAF3355472.1 hypothetical protein VdG1_06884 [Verticillium dahliae VDG1]KAH6686506.1 cytosolic Cu/Zn superoxide dismutase [Verticillium dahliae]EGY18390.1 cytosolic Cu/Zn superoxide dismutase [Verticillium dahliae VdLs.17]PNH26212.1 hypothetical protein BJF96_g10476 [Verticillium dahliae]
MRTQSVLSIIVAAAIGRVAAQEEPVTGELGDAPIVEGNPPGVVYEAVLPEDPFFAGVDIEGNVKGSITAISAPDGVGVEFKVTFSNLPKEGGPFAYHIHDSPATDGNCTSTRAHLDPYKRGQAIPCNPEAPETCEVGDLSGKHGFVESSDDPFEATYVDPYSSLIEGQGSFFGNRSFVLHFSSNLTRITCANFELKAGGSLPQPPKPGHGDNCTSSRVPGVPAPTGVVPEPTESESLVPVPTAAAIMSTVPIGLLGLGVMAAVFGL